MMKQNKNVGVVGLIPVSVLRLVAAFLVLCMTLCQLFTFERFPDMVVAAGVAPGIATFIAIVIVVLEVLALPWLIGMRVVYWVRAMSMVAAVAALSTVTILELMAYCHGVTIVLGATLAIPSGPWSLLYLAVIWCVIGGSALCRSGMAAQKYRKDI